MSEQKKEQRWNIFRELLPHNGKLVTPKSLQKDVPCIPVIKRIKHIIKWHCKPACSPGLNIDKSECLMYKGTTFSLCFSMFMELFDYLRTFHVVPFHVTDVVDHYKL